MKQIFLVLTLALAFLACSDKKESAQSIAQEWCDLNGKVYKAQSESDKEAAKNALEIFEKGIENKYKNDEAFMKEVEKEIEKCEDASEGR